MVQCLIYIYIYIYIISVRLIMKIDKYTEHEARQRPLDIMCKHLNLGLGDLVFPIFLGNSVVVIIRLRDIESCFLSI